MGIIVAVSNPKGGVGKTSIASNLLVEGCLAGLQVRGIDTDPQKSLATWGSMRAEERPEIRLTEQTTTTIRREAQAQSEEADLVVIDCAGRDGKVLRAALLVADLIVVPVVPSPFDVWAGEGFAEVLEEIQSLREDIQIRIVLNQTQPKTRIAKAALGVLDDLQIPQLSVRITSRVAWREAAAEGLGVSELEPKSKAAIECRRVFRELGLSTLQKEGEGQ